MKNNEKNSKNFKNIKSSLIVKGVQKHNAFVFLAMVFFALILIVVQTVTAQESTQEGTDSFQASLGKIFTLKIGQSAQIEGTGIEVLLSEINPICIENQPCIQIVPNATVTVTKNGVSEKLFFTEESKPFVVFGYQISNADIDNISENENSFVGASFILKKIDNEDPKPVTVFVGQKFELQASESNKASSAIIFDSEKELGKLFLHGFVPEAACTLVDQFEGGCKYYASVTVSLLDGTYKNFYLFEGGTDPLDQIGGLFFSFLEVKDFGKTGVFLIEKREESPKDFVKAVLGEKFELKLNQTALISTENLEVSFKEIAKKCNDNGLLGCFEFGVFSVIQKLPEGGQHATQVELAQGQSVDLSNNYRTGLKFQISLPSLSESIAVLLVEKSSGLPSPKPLETLRVLVGEKFELKENQYAYVFDSQESRQLENILLKVWNAGIKSFFPCVKDSQGNKKCENEFLQESVVIQFSSKYGFQTVSLKENEKYRFGEFVLRVLQITPSLTKTETGFVVLLVEKTPIDDLPAIVKVSANENFSMKSGQTVFVAGPDFFMQLHGTSNSSQSAKITVWKNETRTSFGKDFLLGLNESIELYGAKISVLEIGDSKAVFFVSFNENPGTITVNVGDSFWLNEGQTALIPRANMQIDLLDASVKQIYCVTEPCESIAQVELIISNYLFEKDSVGKELAQSVVQTVQVRKDSQTVTADLPPVPFLPFETISLLEGEELQINDFVLKVLTVREGSALLLVQFKPSSFEFKQSFASGWNLFSLPGELDTVKSSCQTENWKIFEFNPSTKSFDKVTKALAGKAYWIFNPGKKCSVESQILNPVKISELKELVNGWNFVPVTVDMIGYKLSEFGSCSGLIKNVFEWNPESKKWQKALTSTISKSDLGKAFAVYALSQCSLSGINDSDFRPPELPSILPQVIASFEEEFKLQETQSALLENELEVQFVIHSPECTGQETECSQIGVFAFYSAIDGKRKRTLSLTKLKKGETKKISDFSVTLNRIDLFNNQAENQAVAFLIVSKNQESTQENQNQIQETESQSDEDESEIQDTEEATADLKQNCELEPDSGSCRAYINKYYFDKESNRIILTKKAINAGVLLGVAAEE